APEQQLLIVSRFHRLRIHYWSSRATWRTSAGISKQLFHASAWRNSLGSLFKRESLLTSFRYQSNAVTRLNPQRALCAAHSLDRRIDLLTEVKRIASQ